MPHRHESQTEHWFAGMSEGQNALLADVVREIATSPDEARASIARSFVAFLTGPRVADGFARRLLGAWNRAADFALAPSTSPQLVALRSRRDQLMRQLDARGDEGPLLALAHQREHLAEQIESKKQTVARMRQAIAAAQPGNVG